MRRCTVRPGASRLCITQPSRQRENNMKDLFIQYKNPHGKPVLRVLTERFNACREQLGRIEALHSEMKLARGARLPESHANEQLRTERDREYDVALIRVELEQGA